MESAKFMHALVQRLPASACGVEFPHHDFMLYDVLSCTSKLELLPSEEC